MGDQDHAYKILFGQRRLVGDLLRGFLPAEPLDALDFDSLERVPAAHIGRDTSGRTRERANDLVWKIRLKTGGALFVYLMLEFQSTIDPWMALRVLGYTALLLQDLVRTGHLAPDGKLPTVLPFVIYNGKPTWTAAGEVAELFTELPGLETFLEPYRPRLRYFLIDEGRLTESALDRPGNLTAALFRIERSEDSDEIRALVRGLAQSWTGSLDLQVWQSVADWLEQVVSSKGLPRLPLQYSENPEELGTMLADTLERWHNEAVQQGRRDGQRKGRQLGRRQGEATIVLKLLQLKFGELDAMTRSRIRRAEPEELELWAQRILTADTLGEVLAAGPVVTT